LRLFENKPLERLVRQGLAQLHDVALQVEAVEVSLTSKFPRGLNRIDLAAHSGDYRAVRFDAATSKANLRGELSRRAGGSVIANVPAMAFGTDIRESSQSFEARTQKSSPSDATADIEKHRS
jgi:hypothetical protein